MFVNGLHRFRTNYAVISRAFPWREWLDRAKGRPRFPATQKGQTMFCDRARTGLGGMIAVTAILLLIQLISGVGAFPL
jgi:hypothetical protein